MADQKVELEVVLNAINNASKELDKVKESLKGLSNTSNEVEKKNALTTASVFKGVAAWDLLKTGVRAVSGFMKESATAAQESARGQAGLNAVLASTQNISGMTSQSVNDIAQNLAKMTNVEDDAIVSGQNMLLTFTHIGKEVFPDATKAMLNMATAMNSGVTPSSEQLKTTAILLGKALNDPIEGVSSLTRNGVALSDTQKEQIANFIKMGDVSSAQKMILKELETEFGGMAEAAMNPMEQSTRAVGELKEELGNMLLPTVREYSEKLRDNAEKLTVFISTHKDSILEIIKLVSVGAGAIAIVYGLANAFTTVKNVINAFTAANRLATLASIGAAGPLILIAALAAGLAAGIMYLSDKFGGLGNAFTVIGKSIQILGQVFVIGFKMLGNTVIGFLNSIFDKGNKAYNYISGLLKKVGVDIGTADLKIDFKFNLEENVDKMNGLATAINEMEKLATQQKKEKSNAVQAKIAEEMAAQQKLADQAAKLAKDAADQMAKDAAAKDTAKEKTDDLKKSIEDLQKEYTDLKKDGEVSLLELSKSHQDKMVSIRNEIDKTKRAIADLSSEYNKGIVSDNKSVAEEIVATEQKIADLKQKLSEETDAKKRAEIQTTLNKEEDALKQSADFSSGLQAEIVEARRRASLTDLQRAIEDYQIKRSLALQEYNAKMSDLQNELAMLKAKETAEVALYDAKVKQINELMDKANVEYAKTMDDHLKKTSDTVNAEIEYFKKLAKAIADARAAESISIMNASVNIAGARAAGGPVQFGEAYLVGEKGPEIFVPGATGNIIPNSGIGGGVSIQVNISGNNINNKMDLREISNKVGESIMNKLRLNTKLAV